MTEWSYSATHVFLILALLGGVKNFTPRPLYPLERSSDTLNTRLGSRDMVKTHWNGVPAHVYPIGQSWEEEIKLYIYVCYSFGSLYKERSLTQWSNIPVRQFFFLSGRGNSASWYAKTELRRVTHQNTGPVKWRYCLAQVSKLTANRDVVLSGCS